MRHAENDYDISDCIRVLEEHLGLRRQHKPIAHASTDSSSRSRRSNPLGFIVDLFRPKRAPSRDPDPHKRSMQEGGQQNGGRSRSRSGFGASDRHPSGDGDESRLEVRPGSLCFFYT